MKYKVWLGAILLIVVLMVGCKKKDEAPAEISNGGSCPLNRQNSGLELDVAAVPKNKVFVTPQ